MTFPDDKMIEAAFETVPGTLGLCLADVEDIFATGLDDYRTRTGIDVADVVAKLSAGTHVIVPVEPTKVIAEAGEQADMNEHGPLVSMRQAAMLYHAMIRAAQEKVE